MKYVAFLDILGFKDRIRGLKAEKQRILFVLFQEQSSIYLMEKIQMEKIQIKKIQIKKIQIVKSMVTSSVIL